MCHHRPVEEDEARRELEATLAARKELGPEYEHHLVESFLDKVEKGLVRRRQDVVPPFCKRFQKAGSAQKTSAALRRWLSLPKRLLLK